MGEKGEIVKRNLKRGWISGLILFIFSCSQPTTNSFLDEAQLLRTRIKAAEAQWGQGDPKAKGDVKKWLLELREVERLALESQEESAQKKLQALTSELNSITSKRDADLSLHKATGEVNLSGKRIGEGATFSQDATITTGPNSVASFRMFHDSQLMILPSSSIRVKKIKPWSRSLFVELKKGGLRYKQTGSESQFTLNAGDYVFDLSETGLFEVSVSGAKGYVLPTRGSVNYVVGSERRQVRFGMSLFWDGTSLEEVLPLTAPLVRKPQAEQTFLLQEGKTMHEVRFEWDTVEKASGYLLSIYSDKDLNVPVVFRELTTTPLLTHQFQDGVYHWRVRAVDSHGTPGFSTRAAWFSVVAEKQEQVSDKRPGPKLRNVDVQVMNDMVIVRGWVSDFASVSVNNTKAVRQQDGNFEVVVSLQSEEQTVTLVATGRDGAQTIKKYEVNADF